MKISEIFYSIQGEGPQTGMAAHFIRTTGCNLTCEWCDTKYALWEGTSLRLQKIFEDVDTSCPNIVITGGEPLIQPDLETLIDLLNTHKKNVYIETNGTIYKKELMKKATFIVSPKLQFLCDSYIHSLKQFISHPEVAFKFVVNDKAEFDLVVQFCDKFDKHQRVYVMPRGTDAHVITEGMKSLSEYIKNDAPYILLSPRLHVLIYGNKRGK